MLLVAELVTREPPVLICVLGCDAGRSVQRGAHGCRHGRRGLCPSLRFLLLCCLVLFGCFRGVAAACACAACSARWLRCACAVFRHSPLGNPRASHPTVPCMHNAVCGGVGEQPAVPARRRVVRFFCFARIAHASLLQVYLLSAPSRNFLVHPATLLMPLVSRAPNASRTATFQPCLLWPALASAPAAACWLHLFFL